MRRLVRRIKGTSAEAEHGASAVITAILLVVLLGFAAIAIDVGMLYSERAQLQNGADAAALAIANDCGKGQCDHAEKTAKSASLTQANSNDAAAQSKSVDFSVPGQVMVTTAKDGEGGNPVRTIFANFLGESTVDVRAQATAVWGTPSSGTTVPWTFGKCVFEANLTPAQRIELAATGNFTGDPSGAHVLLRSDTNANYKPDCNSTDYPNGGFGWLALAGGKCQAYVAIGTGETGGDPGNDIDNACKPELDKMLNAPILVPIFSSNTGNGSNAVYTIYGFAAFQVTGWKFNPMNHPDSLAPACTGNCRGFMGYFKRFVSLEEGLNAGPGPNLGATIVRLTK